MEEKENILEAALENVILMQILTQELELLPPTLNRRRIKNLSNQLIKEMSPVIETHFIKMFFIDEVVTQTITGEYEELARLLTKRGIQNKVFISQALQAHELNPSKSENAIHDILVDELNK